MPHMDLFILIGALILTAVVALFIKDFAILHITARLNARIAAKTYEAFFGEPEEETTFDEHVKTTPGLQTNYKVWE